ncbi:MAG TPA: arginase family protein [Gemmatimonadaceae bacterium]|nr:arginase family protein [Gemmatimonadaceae bacterium]
MRRYAVLDVPSNLGLRPSGVERLPRALRDAGLLERLRARDAGRVEPAAPYDWRRDASTRLLNGPALRQTTIALATRVASMVNRDEVPIVLAGDCSVILGGLLGLRLGAHRVGLVFVDGHVDFYQPDASPTGEVADMDLALATGRGPLILTRFDGADGALVRDEDVVAIGARDADERATARSQDVRATGIHLYELEAVRARGIEAVAADAVGIVARRDLSGFWLHVDADVLDDAVMPAVDYRQPGGLRADELVTLLRACAESGALRGISVAIYNPALDSSGEGAEILVQCLAEGLA